MARWEFSWKRPAHFQPDVHGWLQADKATALRPVRKLEHRSGLRVDIRKFFAELDQTARRQTLPCAKYISIPSRERTEMGIPSDLTCG